MRLFKSDFTHQHYITLRIFTAEETERYGVTDAFPKEEIIEIAMSEAQFARFVTTPNLGCGTPCTIESVRVPPSLREYAGKHLPTIEKEDIRETHRDEIESVCRQRLEELGQVQAQIRQWRIDKHRPTMAELDDLTNQLAGMHLANNFGFLQQLLEEHMEKTIEEARTEIEAHVMQVVNQLGFDELGRRLVKEDEFPKLESREDG
jgi:hypothetical protein